MAREIPEVVRAAAGLVATLLDEARRLPATVPGLPVRVVGIAMQTAMKIQQHYTGLVARGDEVFTGMRGEDEPGLATFDDEEPAPGTAEAAGGGYRESAFDRAQAPHAADVASTDNLLSGVPDEEADAVVEVLEELAIEAMVAETTAPAQAAPRTAAPKKAPAKKQAAKKQAAKKAAKKAAATPAEEPTPDVATTVDVLTAEGDGVAAVEATLTDEGVAAETPAAAPTGEPAAPTREPAAPTREPAAPTEEPAGGSDLAGSQAAGTAPIEGYDAFSIAQLRGRLRGYAHSTVQDLLAYEEATRARDPYLRMLRNRLERLDEQAVEASPLAPRGT
jgi:hypothetical protein